MSAVQDRADTDTANAYDTLFKFSKIEVLTKPELIVTFIFSTLKKRLCRFIKEMLGRAVLARKAAQQTTSETPQVRHREIHFYY